MPDGDVIKRGVKHAWRPAYEVICARPDPETAKGPVLKGLTESLRRRGLPDIGPAAALLKQAWDGEISKGTAVREATTVVKAVGGSRGDQVLERALGQLIANGPNGATPRQAIAENYCRNTIEAGLLSKVGPALLEKGAREPGEVERIKGGILDRIEPEIRQLAMQVLRDPTCSILRAPGSRTPKKSTKHMLDESVE